MRVRYGRGLSLGPPRGCGRGEERASPGGRPPCNWAMPEGSDARHPGAPPGPSGRSAYRGPGAVVRSEGWPWAAPVPPAPAPRLLPPGRLPRPGACPSAASAPEGRTRPPARIGGGRKASKPWGSSPRPSAVRREPLGGQPVRPPAARSSTAREAVCRYKVQRSVAAEHPASPAPSRPGLPAPPPSLAACPGATRPPLKTGPGGDAR